MIVIQYKNKGVVSITTTSGKEDINKEIKRLKAQKPDAEVIYIKEVEYLHITDYEI